LGRGAYNFSPQNTGMLQNATQMLRYLDKVITGWRKLHNEELHHLYFSSNIIRVIRWVRHASYMGGHEKF